MKLSFSFGSVRLFLRQEESAVWREALHDAQVAFLPLELKRKTQAGVEREREETESEQSLEIVEVDAASLVTAVEEAASVFEETALSTTTVETCPESIEMDELTEFPKRKGKGKERRQLAVLLDESLASSPVSLETYKCCCEAPQRKEEWSVEASAGSPQRPLLLSAPATSPLVSTPDSVLDSDVDSRQPLPPQRETSQRAHAQGRGAAVAADPLLAPPCPHLPSASLQSRSGPPHLRAPQ